MIPMPARTDIREPDLVDLDEADGGSLDPDRTLKFRGPSYDEAVQAAEDALGTRPRVLSAHRIQRGGIGGFFATDLGVEVEVEVPGEDVDETLDRLVEPATAGVIVGSAAGAAAGSATGAVAGADSPEDDRAAWIRELARAAGLDIDAFVDPAAAPEPVTEPARPFGYGEYLSELDLGGAEEQDSDLTTPPATTTAPASTSAPVSGAPRPARSARPARPARPAKAAAPPRPERHPARRIAAPARPQVAVAPEPDFDPRHEPDVDPDVDLVDGSADTSPSRRPTVPTRHHVDLAVVATSELVRLSGGFDPGTTVDIQVTVTSSDGRSVSAEATVERPTRPGRRRPEVRR